MFYKISMKKLFDSDNDLPQLWLTSNHPHLFLFNTLSLRQNDPHLADDIFKVKKIVKKKSTIWLEFHWKIYHKGSVDKKLYIKMVKMAWCWTD